MLAVPASRGLSVSYAPSDLFPSLVSRSLTRPWRTLCPRLKRTTRPWEPFIASLSTSTELPAHWSSFMPSLPLLKITYTSILLFMWNFQAQLFPCQRQCMLVYVKPKHLILMASLCVIIVWLWNIILCNLAAQTGSQSVPSSSPDNDIITPPPDGSDKGCHDKTNRLCWQRLLYVGVCILWVFGSHGWWNRPVWHPGKNIKIKTSQATCWVF